MKLSELEGWCEEEKGSLYRKETHASSDIRAGRPTAHKWSRSTKDSLFARYSGYAKLMNMVEGINKNAGLDDYFIFIYHNMAAVSVLRAGSDKQTYGTVYGQHGYRLIDALQECLIFYLTKKANETERKESN